MDVFVIQLAKMTLICIGIFFTPAITRKFVVHLRAPAAQEMMKWGGMALGLGSVAAAKGFLGSKVLGEVAKKGVQRELPAISQGITEATRRWAKNAPHSPIRKLSKNLLEKGNSKIQEDYLKREFERREGSKSSGFDVLKNKGEGSLNSSQFQSFKKEMGEKKDPVSGAFEYKARPEKGLVAASVAKGIQAAVSTKKVIQKAPSSVRAVKNFVSTGRKDFSANHPAHKNNSTSSPPRTGGSRVPAQAVEAKRQDSPAPKSFSDRARAIMTRNLKKMMKMKEKK